MKHGRICCEMLILGFFSKSWTHLPFCRDYFEKKPLLIQREDASYYDGLFHCFDIDALLENAEVARGPSCSSNNDQDAEVESKQAHASALGNDESVNTKVPTNGPSKSARESDGTVNAAMSYMDGSGADGRAPDVVFGDDVTATRFLEEQRKRDTVHTDGQPARKENVCSSWARCNFLCFRPVFFSSVRACTRAGHETARTGQVFSPARALRNCCSTTEAFLDWMLFGSRYWGDRPYVKSCCWDRGLLSSTVQAQDCIGSSVFSGTRWAGYAAFMGKLHVTES